jgi:hypothetical protein
MPDALLSDKEGKDLSFTGGRCSLEDLDNFIRLSDEFVIHEVNSTCELSKEGPFDYLGLLKCEAQHRRREMEELGFACLPVVHETATRYAVAEALAMAHRTPVGLNLPGRYQSVDLHTTTRQTRQCRLFFRVSLCPDSLFHSRIIVVHCPSP